MGTILGVASSGDCHSKNKKNITNIIYTWNTQKGTFLMALTASCYTTNNEYDLFLTLHDRQC